MQQQQQHNGIGDLVVVPGSLALQTRSKSRAALISMPSATSLALRACDTWAANRNKCCTTAHRTSWCVQCGSFLSAIPRYASALSTRNLTCTDSQTSATACHADRRHVRRVQPGHVLYHPMWASRPSRASRAACLWRYAQTTVSQLSPSNSIHAWSIATSCDIS